MSDNRDSIGKWLGDLGLSSDEAAVYVELLKGPKSHLLVARSTGINRTKVYRIADELEKRGLVSAHFDDEGSALVASDPTTLEVELVNNEEAVKRQRVIFNHVLPELQKLQQKGSKGDFEVNTYQGTKGFKQMLWHELKAKDELLVIGSTKIENLVENVRWSEKHRAMTVEAGYVVRDLFDSGTKPEPFTRNQDFMTSHYEARMIDKNILSMQQTISIYNNTVSIYHWRGKDKLGVEIVSPMNAAMMRQIFEYYWRLAEISKHKAIGEV